MTNGSTAQDARRARRRITYAPSTLRVAGTRPVDVTVYDISETGIRFACDQRLEEGDELSIGLAGSGAARAFVAWARDGQYGCDFVLPISQQEVESAFGGSTVVRLGHSASATPNPVRERVAAQVDDVYARHRRWALPRDVTIVAASIVLVAASALWLYG